MINEGEVQSIELDSKPESLSVVERMIEEIRDTHNVSEDTFGNILVAMTEAVTNAIYHGNKSDSSKKVRIQYGFIQNTLSFTVTDEGPGFDFYHLPDPTAPENLDKECGRGIFLMKHLADQLIFSDGGRVVELHFKLNS
jgi:serine/threonine-protein kinase RsbW